MEGYNHQDVDLDTNYFDNNDLLVSLDSHCVTGQFVAQISLSIPRYNTIR